MDCHVHLLCEYFQTAEKSAAARKKKYTNSEKMQEEVKNGRTL